MPRMLPARQPNVERGSISTSTVGPIAGAVTGATTVPGGAAPAGAGGVVPAGTGPVGGIDMTTFSSISGQPGGPALSAGGARPPARAAPRPGCSARGRPPERAARTPSLLRIPG